MRRINFALLLPAFAIGLLSCNSPEAIQPPTTVSSEIAAREVVGSILFDQRTHYIENQSFATNIKDLQEARLATNSLHYAYRLNTKHAKNIGAVITASPKQANLRSFTGVVFAIPTSQGAFTVSEICETIDPSKKPPTPPSIPKRASEAIQCPAGSRSAFAGVAEG